MKILIISHMYPNENNPIAGIFVHEQVMEIQKQGHHVNVVSPIPYSSYLLSKISMKWKRYYQHKKFTIIDNIEVHYPRYITFPKGFFFASSSYRMYRSVKKLIIKLHQQQGFDLIHAHVALPDGHTAMRISKEIGVPYVTTIHGQDFAATINRNKKCFNLISETISCSDAVILVSTKLDRIRLERFPQHSNHFYIIHNGVSDRFLNESVSRDKDNIYKENLILLSVSNLISIKGIDTNIRALKEVIQQIPHLLYLIIGEGHEKTKLEKLIVELGLQNHVRFLGTKSREEVKRYMDLCDVFSLPSWNEAFGVVYIEAMARSKPVIGCYGQGIEDIVNQGNSGWLLRPKDVHNLASTLLKLLQDRNLRITVGEQARRTVLDNFTWERNVKKTVQVYEKVVAVRNRGSDKLKVCHLTSVHSYTDIRIYVKECQSLASAGYETHLISPEAPNGKKEGIHLHGVKVYGGDRFLRMTRTVWTIYKIARQIDAHLYHFHDPELIPIGLLLRIQGRKVIYDVHEDVPRQIMSKSWIPKRLRKTVSWLFEKLEDFASKQYSAIVTATPFIQERFLRFNSLTINVNNYPILQELHVSDVEWHKKECAVCYVGGIDFVRGIFEMVKAIDQTNAKLLLAGNVPSSIRNQVQQLQGWKQVEELGFLNRNEVLHTMSKSRAGLVVLHPIVNYIDALPIKMFEYMSSSLPVIASQFPLWKNIIEENQCGICVDPMNPQSIADAIQWVLDNPDEAKRMGENGRKTIEEKYNWENEENKLLHLYEEILI